MRCYVCLCKPLNKQFADHASITTFCSDITRPATQVKGSACPSSAQAAAPWTARRARQGGPKDSRNERAELCGRGDGRR